VKESDLHEWLRDKIPPGKGVLLGIGDDAALLDGDGPLAAASDILVEGVHFTRPEAGPDQIGAKALNRNLSDMAAMGLEPRWCLVSAAVPKGTTEKFLKTMIESMTAAAGRFGACLVGGDTARSPGPLVVDVTVLAPVGELSPVTRSGAAAGDRILVTGTLGGSSLGWHLDFVPRVSEGVHLNRHARPTAMIDISDGLDRDLCRILDASGVGARLDGDRIPLSQAARRLSARTGRDPLDHALTDGEDFELLFTVPPERAAGLESSDELAVPVTDIGEIVPRGTRIVVRGGSGFELKGEGFDHTF